MDYTTTMKHLFKKILSGVIVLTLSVAPIAYAQEIPVETQPAVAEATSSGVEPDAPVSSETPTQTEVDTTIVVPIDLQGTSASVQDTSGTQDAVTSDVLESTANPATSTESTSTPLVEDTATTTPVVPIEIGIPTDATSTPLAEATSTLDVVAEDIDTSPKDLEEVPTEPAPLALRVPVADLDPEPTFTFALTGKQIATKRTLTSRDGKKVGEQTVSASLVPQVDNAKGELTVSGQCSDVYFVVLLYKNQNDYADDPSSYVVNRAYPCVNGAYSYSISELPHTLANGTYYLLVGQEGERGTWTPITSLTEITITNN